MFFFQIFLILYGLTTNDYMRNTFYKKNNPFNFGFFKNIYNFFKNDSDRRLLSNDYFIEKSLYLSNQFEISNNTNDTFSKFNENKFNMSEISLGSHDGNNFNDI